MTQHKHYNEILAFINGEEVEMLLGDSGTKWMKVWLLSQFDTGQRFEFRIKPKTVR